MMYYTGIGSRSTPDNVLVDMQSLAWLFGKKGLILRSGGAEGADTAFEKGADEAEGLKEIFLPWQRFNNNLSPLFEIPEHAYVISAKYHRAWPVLQTPVRRLMARNVQQVLGKNLDSPSSFVVCWTPDGCTHHDDRTAATGGTGQAISIATGHGIPIFNLKNDDAIERITQMVTSQLVDHLDSN